MLLSLPRARARVAAKASVSSVVALLLSGCLFYGNELCDPNEDPAGCLAQGPSNNPGLGGAGVPGSGGRINGSSGGSGGVEASGGRVGSGGRDGAGGEIGTGGNKGTGGSKSTGGEGSGGDGSGGASPTTLRELQEGLKINEIRWGSFGFVEIYNKGPQELPLGGLSVTANDAAGAACSLEPLGGVASGGYVLAQLQDIDCLEGSLCVKPCSFPVSYQTTVQLFWNDGTGDQLVDSRFVDLTAGEAVSPSNSYRAVTDGGDFFERGAWSPGTRN